MTIVVGYVPTSEGRAALDRAAQESHLRRVGLVVVKSARPGREVDDAQTSQFEAHLASIAAALDSDGIEHEVRTLEGRDDPSDNLIAVAEETGAIFIVIGLRRRSTVGKLFLGSHAQRILLDAACPVLAVKASD